MHWNYRVIKTFHSETGEAEFRIHEVYYDENGNINGWTQDPISSFGTDLGELREDIRYHLTAFHKPILKEVDNKLVPDEDEVVINDGHYAEAMDRVSVAIDYLNDFVSAHPVIRKTETAKALFAAIDEKMGELYVELGKLAVDKKAI